MKKPKQLEFKKITGWGGKRRNSGRKNKSGTVGHAARETVDFKRPLHVTKRLKRGLRGLRTKSLRSEFEKSLVKAKAKGLRVIHFSIEDNHLHLFVETKSNKTLASGMNSLATKFAKAVRKKLGGAGAVFDGRYHLRVLKSPRQVRNALAYVLLNHSKHQKLIPDFDDYSSAGYFKNWRQLLGKDIGPILADRPLIARPLPDHLCEPNSWLAREGWRKVS